jgi:hypothetical protein
VHKALNAPETGQVRVEKKQTMQPVGRYQDSVLSAERHLVHENYNGIHENGKGICWMYSVNNSETATQDAGGLV